MMSVIMFTSMMVRIRNPRILPVEDVGVFGCVVVLTLPGSQSQGNAWKKSFCEQRNRFASHGSISWVESPHLVPEWNRTLRYRTAFWTFRKNLPQPRIFQSMQFETILHIHQFRHIFPFVDFPTGYFGDSSSASSPFADFHVTPANTVL